MKEIVSNPKLVAACGLYCGACGAYLKEKCAGCADAKKRGWCKVRACCKDNGWATCAECTKFSNPNDCKLFNNVMSKIFSFLFRSDRAACIARIKGVGLQGYADEMAAARLQSIKR